MGQCFSVIVVALQGNLSLLTKLAQAADVELFASDSEFSCATAGAGASDNCTFHCDEITSAFSCDDVAYCTIDCAMTKGFEGAVIDASNVVNQLTVKALSGSSECFKMATINLPNNGDAIFENETEEKGFKAVQIYAGTNTQNIIIDCTNSDAALFNDECKGMGVYASDAEYLEITIGDGGDMEMDEKVNDPGEIECPQGSSYNGPEIAPCIIDLSGGGGLFSTYDITTLNGIPADVWIKTGTNNLVTINVQCTAGTSSNSGNSWDETSACWNPSPTKAPTHATEPPTRAPTQATESPTKGTEPPSRAPTQPPTRAPTQTTEPPSRAPTQPPTRAPTQATESPTRAPIQATEPPSRAPTQPPTRAPTQATESPSRAPILATTKAYGATQQDMDNTVLLVVVLILIVPIALILFGLQYFYGNKKRYDASSKRMDDNINEMEKADDNTSVSKKQRVELEEVKNNENVLEMKEPGATMDVNNVQPGVNMKGVAIKEEGMNDAAGHQQINESGDLDDIYVKNVGEESDDSVTVEGPKEQPHLITDEAQNEKKQQTKGDMYYDAYYDEIRNRENNINTDTKLSPQ